MHLQFEKMLFGLTNAPATFQTHFWPLTSNYDLNLRVWTWVLRATLRQMMLNIYFKWLLNQTTNSRVMHRTNIFWISKDAVWAMNSTGLFSNLWPLIVTLTFEVWIWVLRATLRLMMLNIYVKRFLIQTQNSRVMLRTKNKHFWIVEDAIWFMHSTGFFQTFDL